MKTSAPIFASISHTNTAGEWLRNAWDPALLVFVPLLALSVYTAALVLHSIGLLRRTRTRMRGMTTIGAHQDPWVTRIANASPLEGDGAVRVAFDECLAPYDAVLARIGLCRDLSLPLAMLACAVKMITALSSIGTVSIARSSELIGASLWGTAFGICIHVAAAIAGGWLNIAVSRLEAALYRAAVEASRTAGAAERRPSRPSVVSFHKAFVTPVVSAGPTFRVGPQVHPALVTPKIAVPETSVSQRPQNPLTEVAPVHYAQPRQQRDHSENSHNGSR